MPSFDSILGACCSANGYGAGSDKELIARAAVDATLKHLHELPPLLCGAPGPGASKAELRKWKKDSAASALARERALHRAIIREKAAAFGLDADKVTAALSRKETWGIIVGLAILVFGGPEYLFLTVICSVGSWIIEGELEERWPQQALQACAATYRTTLA